MQCKKLQPLKLKSVQSNPGLRYLQQNFKSIGSYNAYRSCQKTSYVRYQFTNATLINIALTYLGTGIQSFIQVKNSMSGASGCKEFPLSSKWVRQVCFLLAMVQEAYPLESKL